MCVVSETTREFVSEFMSLMPSSKGCRHEEGAKDVTTVHKCEIFKIVFSVCQRNLNFYHKQSNYIK